MARGRPSKIMQMCCPNPSTMVLRETHLSGSLEHLSRNAVEQMVENGRLAGHGLEAPCKFIGQRKKVEFGNRRK